MLLLLMLLQSRSLCGAAEYVLPAKSRIDWSLSGVPGGVQQYVDSRTTLIDVTQAPYNADKTGVIDATPAIQAAVKAAKAGQVVYLPDGTYKMDGSVNVGYKDDITIRGAGPALTIINYTYGSGAAFSFGGGANYLWNYPQLPVTGNPAKGSSILAVASTAEIPVGMICKLDLDDSKDYSLNAELPLVINTAAYPRSRQAMHRVTAKTATTITIEPPLAFPLTSTLNPKINMASQQCERSGIEDLKIVATASKYPSVLYFEQCWSCWARNVEIRYSNNYSLYMVRSVQCAVERCLIADSQGGGSNHSGQLTDRISFCRFENNIVINFELCVQMNGSTGNVFGYNFYGQSPYTGFNTNHGAHCSFNLYEGNILQSSQSDGYHGSGSQDVGFRNWYTGDRNLLDTIKEGRYTIVLNRFCRQYCFIGNVLGVGGNGATYVYSFGNPNMGNSAFTGTASPSTGDDWLTITSGEYPWSPYGTRAATTFQEKDLDVEASTLRVHNWASFPNSIVPGEALPAGDTLPQSLYLTAKPPWFGDLAWPPVDSSDPKFDPLIIPAGYRFIRGSNPPGIMNPTATRPKPVSGLKKL
jgi:hypothetical protein